MAFPQIYLSSTRSSQALFGILVTYALLACLSVWGDGQEPRLQSNWKTATALDHNEFIVKRSDFARDFVFGSSTAAIQIEGSSKAGGRGPSVWDYFVENHPEKIDDGSNLDVAIDSYVRYKEDVKAVKDLGVDSYRFSISWTRILPTGSLSGGINQEGINHYNSLIDELVHNGIKPFVTIFHFDSPQELQEKYLGPLSRSFVNDFKDYAEICFRTFGDRVKNWITINEPLIIAKLGHSVGIAPPGRCSDRKFCQAGNSSTEPYIAAHNLLLSHATAYRLYKDKFQAIQGGQVGISLVGQYIEPYSFSLEDQAAAKRVMDFELGWFVEPLVFGDYPRSMRQIVKERLPTFTPEDKILIKGASDFIGINYYTARYAKGIPIEFKNPPTSFINDQFANVTVDKNGVLIGPKSEGSYFIYIYPEGLEKLLVFMKNAYLNPAIYITENGVTERRNDSLTAEIVTKDQHRINFVLRHLYRIRKALGVGVNVKGYFYWSLFDDFEWGEGFIPRYGLYYTDYKNNLTRVPKQSAKWFHGFLNGTYHV